MRIITSSSKIPDFQSFEYVEESPEAIRLPKGDVMMEIERLRKTRKTVIMTSDDEDDVQSPPTQNNHNGDGWLEKRNPKLMSESDKKFNQSIAKDTLSSRRIRKKGDFNYSYYDNSNAKSPDIINKRKNIIDIIETPEEKLNPDRMRLQELATSVHNRKVMKENERQARLEKRQAIVRPSKKRKIIQDSDDEEDNVNGEPEVEYVGEEEGSAQGDEEQDEDDDNDNPTSFQDNEYSKNEIVTRAKLILSRCNDVSNNLRRALRRWKSSKTTEGYATDKENNSCVDMTSINVNGQLKEGEMLFDSDIRQLCPGLELKEYQLVGVNWLKLLHQNEVNGVLADDMGLGKTIQTISFLGWLHHHNDMNNHRHRPHLIIVPASTLNNWLNELHRFCPSFHVRSYHGTQAERYEMRKIIKNEIESGTLQIILSTYTLFERESGAEDRIFLQNQSFDYLILDEAHCLKNSESTRHSKLVKLSCRHRLLLSGTPVQNDLKELLSLLSFLMPKLFRSKDCELLLYAFSDVNITNNSSNNNSNNNNAHKSNGLLSIRHVREMLSPFVLRRLKANVLSQLGTKECLLELISMTTAQQKIYDDILLAYKNHKLKKQIAFEEEKSTEEVFLGKKLKKALSSDSIIDLSVSPSSTLPLTPENTSDPIDLTTETSINGAGRGRGVGGEGEGGSVKVTKSEGGSSQMVADSDPIRELSNTEINSLFTALRKAANHPLLLRIHFQNPKDIDLISETAFHNGYFGKHCTLDMVRKEVEDMSDFDINRLCIDYPRALGHLQLDESTLYESPKMMKLKEMLPTLISQGHRMLIFSQWTRLLDLLEVLMDDMDLPYLRLDGSTPVRERQSLIDQFNRDTTIPVFLLATKAGGLGINLTAADTVILHDIDFNPENDRQAEDRCHRIGQTKPVKVIRLVTKGSVDESIYELSERKKKLSSAVLDDENGSEGGRGKSSKDDENKGDIAQILRQALEKSMMNRK